MIFHEWNDLVLFEYHHELDPVREVPKLCTVRVTHEVGLERYKKEWDEMYGNLQATNI